MILTFKIYTYSIQIFFVKHFVSVWRNQKVVTYLESTGDDDVAFFCRSFGVQFGLYQLMIITYSFLHKFPRKHSRGLNNLVGSVRQ